jgi:hypothetical protein
LGLKFLEIFFVTDLFLYLFKKLYNFHLCENYGLQKKGLVTNLVSSSSFFVVVGSKARSGSGKEKNPESAMLPKSGVFLLDDVCM